MVTVGLIVLTNSPKTDVQQYSRHVKTFSCFCPLVKSFLYSAKPFKLNLPSKKSFPRVPPETWQEFPKGVNSFNFLRLSI